MTPQLRRLALPVGEGLSRAIADFDCLGDISATYLFIDSEQSPQLIGYATLTVDSIRLTNAEKRRMEGLIGMSDFGAMRIQIIGIDHRHQGAGYGLALLEAITGLARKLSRDIAIRFLLADANVRKVGWYEAVGFVRNKAQRYKERPDPSRNISMRLDLLDGLHERSSDRADSRNGGLIGTLA